MRNIFVLFLLLGAVKPAFPQNAKDFTNATFLGKLNKDTSYLELKKKVVSGFVHAKPGRWGEFVNGVEKEIHTQHKYIAFTFDACGGKNGNGYDKELIDFLHYGKIPATLFVSRKWIDANFTAFINLSKDTLFEIENHGLNHKPCSINGESAYGIQSTSGVEEAFDEACVKMAGELGITVVSFEVLSGDAVAFIPDSVIEDNVLKSIKPGAIVIMHFNHPEWHTYEAMQKIVPKLRQMGYVFVRLKDFEVTFDK